jgi:translation initiation factor IF-3
MTGSRGSCSRRRWTPISKYDRRPPKIEEPLINERIRAARVRLIGADGEQLGIFKTQDAQDIADEQGLDLVEVAPNSDPPVARIMDYSKYKYELAMKAKRAKKHHTTVSIKEIKFRPKIDDHDYETKKRHVVRFLEAGAKVKITIMFRGREMVHADRGLAILDRLAEDVRDLGTVETVPKLEGRNLHMMMAPVKQERRKKDETEEIVAIEPEVAVEEIVATEPEAAVEEIATTEVAAEEPQDNEE